MMLGKNKINLMILGLIIVLAIIFGLYFLLAERGARKDLIPEKPSPVSIQDLEENNPDLCKQIQDENQRDNCLIQLAINTDDCELISDPNKRDDCLLPLLARGVINDIKQCDLFSSLNNKDSCLALIQKDPQLCEKLEGESRDLCFIDLSQRLNDRSLCEKVLSEEFKEEFCW
jgi:hypothetical protein